MTDTDDINTEDSDLEDLESPHFIAVYKPGLTKLVKQLAETQRELFEAKRRIQELEAKLPKECA